jgi:hypothetical protein
MQTSEASIGRQEVRPSATSVRLNFFRPELSPGIGSIAVSIGGAAGERGFEKIY